MIKNNFTEVFSKIRTPFQRFFKIEASGGIVLIIFTAIALVWANSPWGDFYRHLWENELSFHIGDFVLSHTILHWINDGLMVIFFFVVGLEIKREMVAGELSSVKQASLPIAAAIGGMLFPAAIFAMLNRSPETLSGWGIPMATDIAFSLGVLSLLGKRVPLSLKVFLVAFAIVDDLGAVLVIALFYSHDIYWNFLLLAMVLWGLLIGFNRFGVRSIPTYIFVGLVIWFLFLKSGIHPTIAGVLIAFTIPVKRKIQVRAFGSSMSKNLVMFSPEDCEDGMTLNAEQLHNMENMEELMDQVRSPLQSLEHRLHGFVTFFIMPIFALTNAGVVFIDSSVSSFFSALSFNIEFSLIIGKVLGIFLFSFIAVKLGLAVLPPNVKWKHIMGLGFLGGMGFTMSLFISNLAFSTDNLLNPAKMGILIGSFTAGIIGYFVLRSTLKLETEEMKK